MCLRISSCNTFFILSLNFISREERTREQASRRDPTRSSSSIRILPRRRAECRVESMRDGWKKKKKERRTARGESRDAMYASNERTITPCLPCAERMRRDGPWAPCEIIITLHDPRHNAFGNVCGTMYIARPFTERQSLKVGTPPWVLTAVSSASSRLSVDS